MGKRVVSLRGGKGSRRRCLAGFRLGQEGPPVAGLCRMGCFGVRGVRPVRLGERPVV